MGLSLLAALPFVGATVYLLGSGFVFRREFQRRLQALLKGDPNPLGRGWLLRLYGVHLVLLVFLTYAGLALSLFMVVDLGYVALFIFTGALLSGPLTIGLMLVIIASIWGIIRGVFGGVGGQRPGITVSRETEPVLWRFSETCAGAMGTRPADVIVLDPRPGIGVSEEGPTMMVLLGRGERVLTLGAPSLAGLTVGQLSAILTHEYAHFSGRDTAWGALTYRAWLATAHAVATMRSAGAFFIAADFLASINPARWLLEGYLHVFWYVVSGFKRFGEVRADQLAIERSGAEHFKAALLGVVTYDLVFATMVHPRMARLAYSHEILGNAYDELDKTVATTPRDRRDALLQAEMARPRQVYDAHPTLADRLAYAVHLEPPSPSIGSASGPSPTDGMPGDDDPARALFSDWRRRTLALTDIYSAFLLEELGGD